MSVAKLQALRPTWNAKRRRFVREYMVRKDFQKAALAAGYSGMYGWELLQMPHIKAEIQRLQDEIATKLEVTKEKIVEELAKIGFANMADYMKVGDTGDPQLDWSKLNRDQAAALIEVTVEDYLEGRGKDARNVRRVKFKLADKRAALVDLGKHLGLFNDKIQHDGQIQITIKQYGAELAAAMEAERRVERQQNGSA